MVVIQVANTGSFMTAVPRGVMQVADNIETKNLLDKLRQPLIITLKLFIYLRNLYSGLMTKKLNVFGVNHA